MSALQSRFGSRWISHAARDHLAFYNILAASSKPSYYSRSSTLSCMEPTMFNNTPPLLPRMHRNDDILVCLGSATRSY